MDNVAAVLLGIAVVFLVIYVVWLRGRISTNAQQQFANWRDREIESIREQQKEIAQSEALAKTQEQALEHFRQWRDKELDAVRKEQMATAQREALTSLDRWKADYEQTIRLDAAKRSQGVITGKVTEQLVPFLPSFRYNPKDARFIGSPVDFVVFDGLDTGEVRQVVFMEIKTGSSSLNKRERQVRDAVDARKIKWEELRIDYEHIVRQKPGLSPSTSPLADTTEIKMRAYSVVENYQVGETISHDSFGTGRVIAVQHTKIEVQFLRGIKVLVQAPR